MIIGLAGYARSGKDTVGNHLVEKHGFKRIAFADALKKMAYTLNPLVPAVPENPAAIVTMRLQPLVNEVGWDNAKSNSEVRRILQVLGTECGRDIIGPNIWVSIVVRAITENGGIKDNWVITDCRFENETWWVKETGKLWWIDRDGVGPLNAHASENLVKPEDADTIIHNRGNLSYLYAAVDHLMEGLND